jgi:microcystin-dependent protein
MSGSIYDWTISPDSNATNDGDINWVEFQDPATVNNSARRMMGRLAETLDDMAPIRTSTGVGNAYAITVASSPGTVTLADGFIAAFVADKANTAGGCTLAVNAFASVPLRAQTGTNMPASAIQSGAVIIAYYKTSTNEFLALNTGAMTNAWLTAFQSTDLTARLLKVGTVLAWPGSNLPGGYLYADGSTVSRTTYAELFTAYGTTYGVGDGSTTFGLPDYRGRALFGRDDMGGSAANRITNAASGITGTTLGATGGAQTITLARSALPNVTLATDSQGNHTHTFAGNVSAGGAGGVETSSSHGTPNNPATTSSNGAHTHTTDSINGGVTQTAVNNMSPAAICNYIIFASPPLAAAGSLGTNGLQYTFDTGTSDADPGAGKLRFDNAAPASATHIYLSKTDAIGAVQTTNLSNVFGSSSSTKGTVLINKVGLQGTCFSCLVTAIDTSPTNYVRLTIQSNSLNGSFASGDSLGMQNSRTGDPGAQGSKSSITLVNGLNSDIAKPSNTSNRLVGPSGVFTVGGFTGGADGTVLRIYNTVAFAMTLKNEDGSSTTTNRIKTLTGADVTLRSGTSFAYLEYDGTDQRWILVSTN